MIKYSFYVLRNGLFLSLVALFLPAEGSEVGYRTPTPELAGTQFPALKHQQEGRFNLVSLLLPLLL